MARRPTIWQTRWAKARRPLLLVLLALMIGSLILGWFGVVAILLVAVLGIGALGAGVPGDNGSAVPPPRIWG